MGDVTAICLAYNQPQKLGAMLASLKGCPELAEIIVWDNSPEASFREQVERAGARYLGGTGTNYSFSEANNRASTHAASEYLLFVNDDVVVPWEAVASIRGLLGQGATMVGPKLLYPPNESGVSLVQSAGHGFDIDFNPYPLWRGAPVDHPLLRGYRPVSSLQASCLMIRARNFCELGRFDESMLWSYQDVDLGLRAREQGGAIFCDMRVHAYHHEAASAAEKPNVQADWQAFARKWLQGRIFECLGVWPFQTRRA